MKHGKKYVDSLKLIDKSKNYEASEAIALCVQTGKAKFDETVEVHVRLGVDNRHADQQVRGAIVLPNGTGKTVRVLAICKGDNVALAQEAGAEYVGAEEFTTKIQNEGWMDFDVLITTPDMMGLVGRLGKVDLCLTQKLAQLLLTSLRLSRKLRQVRLNIVLIRQTSFTAQSVRFLSVLKRFPRTSMLFLRLSSRQSQLLQRVSMLRALPLQQQWDHLSELTQLNISDLTLDNGLKLCYNN